MALGVVALFPDLPNYRETALRLMEESSRYPVGGWITQKPTASR
jgi:hypothetical protein